MISFPDAQWPVVGAQEGADLSVDLSVGNAI